MPHANSRFSRPRAISPRASDGTLPCSAVSWAASSWRRVLDEVADLEHDVGALARARSRARPGRRPSRPRRRHRPRPRRRSRRIWRPAGGRVEDRRPRGPTCLRRLAADPVADPGGCGVGRAGRSGFCDLSHGRDLERGAGRAANRVSGAPRYSVGANMRAARRLPERLSERRPRARVGPAQTAVIGRARRTPSDVGWPRVGLERSASRGTARHPTPTPIAINAPMLSGPTTAGIAPGRRHGRPGERPRGERRRTGPGRRAGRTPRRRGRA